MEKYTSGLYIEEVAVTKHINLEYIERSDIFYFSSIFQIVEVCLPLNIILIAGSIDILDKQNIIIKNVFHLNDGSLQYKVYSTITVTMMLLSAVGQLPGHNTYLVVHHPVLKVTQLNKSILLLKNDHT